MTWIVGMPTMFGYSIGISDIRVTLADSSERDCLQKIYPIANSIALGFAGSVFLGFQMIAAMRLWLQCDEPDCAWKPLETVELWPPLAKQVFAAAPPSEQKLRCALMMLSADPAASNGMFARTYAHIFNSPDFVPVQISTHKATGIGSGTAIREFSAYLDEISNVHDRNFNLMKMEAGMPGGMGANVGFSLTNMLKRTNPSGISSHLHYCWVYLGKTIIKTNNHSTLGPWTALEDGSGSGVNQPEQSNQTVGSLEADGGVAFRMPQIAQSWKEFNNILSSSGATAEGSVT